MPDLWPPGFRRVPDAEWTKAPVASLARKYDSVEAHGWYDNLTPTVDALLDHLDPGDRLLDYSGGTGILIDRLVEAGLGRVGVLNLDASPKFLRLCLEKFREDERVALRRLPYLSDEGRLAYVDEVLPKTLLDPGFDAVASTNAIHLYHDLVETLAGWRRAMAPGARAFVQSGNIDRKDRPSDRWVLDETVTRIADAARGIAHGRSRFSSYRERLDDEDWMREHREYRERVFPPIRERTHYEEAFAQAGLELLGTEHRAIRVRVDEWTAFLAAYADAVVGWVGGAEKVTGDAPGEQALEDRRALLEAAAGEVFEDETFQAEWTYWTLA